MKARLLTLFAALVAAVSLALSGGYTIKALADERDMLQNIQKQTQQPNINEGAISGYAKPGNVQKTCSGDAIGPTAKFYYFGYKRLDGFCMTRDVVANSAGEAQMCAKSYCTNCTTVEDLTLRHETASSTFTNSVVYAYCPAK